MDGCGKYRTRTRLSLSQVLDSLKYKPRNIKEMPPNFKEKNRLKLAKNYYKHGLILRGYGILMENYDFNELILIGEGIAE